MPHEPLYRPVIRDAFQATWHAKRLWFFALFAGILLSGSVYDVVWRLMNAVAPQASLLSFMGVFWSKAASTWSGFSLSNLVFGGLAVFQFTAVIVILGVAVAGLSVVSQGALVFTLGTARRSGKMPTVRESLTVGARAFWPVLVLNLLSLAILLAVRSLLTIFLSIAATAGSTSAYILYLVAFIVFVLMAAIVTIIEIYALNAMILQGATLAQGIVRGAQLLQRHWVISFETAVLLFLLAAAIWVLTVAANAVLAVPIFLLLLLSAVLQSAALLQISLWILIAVFIILVFAIGGALVTLQYAAWTLLYRRLGEGGALPKIHRWIRQLTHGFKIPGA